MPDEVVKRIPKRSLTWTPDRIRRAVADFLNFDTTAQKFASQANEIKLLLRDTVLPQQGEADDHGHRWIMWENDPLPDPAGKGEVIGIKRQRSAPKSLNVERAMEFLRRKGLLEQCTETVEMLNED